MRGRILWSSPASRPPAPAGSPPRRRRHRVLAAGHVPVERGLARLKNWRVLTKLRADPAARATHLFRALLVLTNSEASTGN